MKHGLMLLIFGCCALFGGREKAWGQSGSIFWGFNMWNVSPSNTAFLSWDLHESYDFNLGNGLFSPVEAQATHGVIALSPQNYFDVIIPTMFWFPVCNGHLTGVVKWFADASGQSLIQADTVDVYFAPPVFPDWIQFSGEAEYYCTIASHCGTDAPSSNLNNTDPDADKAEKGDPINTINGAVTADATDVAIPCPGIPLIFSRSYNSTLNYSGPLGPRWTHSLNWTLTPTNTTLPGSSGSWRVVQTGTGDQWAYGVIANNVFGPTFDNATQLTFTNSAYNLAFPGGVNYVFGTNGVLQSICDAWNNQVTLSYTNVAGTNLLLSATHSAGQSLGFAYQGGLLTGVSTPSTNLSVSFFYNSLNELTGVVTRTASNTFPTAYLYDYSTNFCNHSLTQKVNAVGDVYSWQYATNANGTVASKGIRALIGTNYIDSRFSYVATNGTYCTTLQTQRGTNTIFNDYWFDPKELRITKIAGPGSAATNCETAGTGVQYGYDSTGNATDLQVYDNNLGASLSTWNQYDACHNLTNTATAYCAAPSNAFSFGWDTNWNVMTLLTDPDGHRVAMQYTNGAIAKASVFYAASNSFDTLYSYTTNGLVFAVTNANGHGVNFLYDSKGNRIATIPQLGPSNSMAWDSLGHLTNIFLCGGAWVGSGNPNDPSQTFVPRTISFRPDELGRNRKTTWPDGFSETFGWDAIGNPTNYVDRGGRTTTLTWLPTRKLASVTRYLAEAGNQPATIGVAYDQQFNTLRITDELGRSAESYQLDLQDRPASISNVESQQMTVVWGLGRMLGCITRFDGTTNSFVYNSDGRLRQTIFPDDTNAFTYYRCGSLMKASNHWGSISNSFDGANRLAMTTSSIPNSAVNYTYFPAGQVSNISSVAGISSYTLDEADRILTQSILRPNAAADSLAYSYNPDNGLIAGVAYSNGIAYANSFDVCDRLAALAWTGPSNNVLASRTYVYNVTGTISQETGETGEQAQYGYDSLDRLTTETHFDPAGEVMSSVIYGYDLAGNRTNKTVYGSGGTRLATVNYMLGVGNRLASWSVAETGYVGQVDVAGYSSKAIGTNSQFGILSVDGGNTPLTPVISGTNFAAYGVTMGLGTQQVVAAIRDQAGNVGFATNTIFMTVVTNGTYLYNTAGCLTNIQYSGSQYSKTVGLMWNGQYQLTAASTNGIAAERYGFDALGKRVWIWDGSATNFLIYDGAQVIAEVDATGGLKRAYAYAPGIDQAISMAVYSSGVTSAPTVYYYLRDHLGSVLALSDTNGNICESYRYDAWGRTTVYDVGGNALSKSAMGNRIAFQGREYSWATGLYYFRARWYDPVTGRWLSPDPIGINGGLNQYVFCANNPVNFTDPLGLSFLGRVGNGFTGAAAGAGAGAASGALIGAGIGAFGAGVGALPGAGAGATAGAIAGALGGFVGGVLSGPDYNVGSSASAGAINGALAGLTGGAGEVGGVAWGLGAGAVSGGLSTRLSTDDPAIIALGALLGAGCGGLGAEVSGEVSPLEQALFNANSEIIGQDVGLYIPLFFPKRGHCK